MLSDIYETIGHRFFTGLSSPNKALYINCLDSIYAMSEGQISHIHTRERLHQNIESCIAETHAVLYGLDGTEVSDTLSKRASEVMYSLIEYGWLVSEDIEDAFGQNVYLSEPGTALIRFLRALAQPVQKEYTTFIFNMYNALTNRKQWEDNPYALMLKPVYDNATGLYDALQDLNTYLKDIIKRMGSHTTYEELFENLSDYVEGMFLKQYSRLIRQNVHSYGAVIIRVLGEVREEPAMVQKLIDGYKTENDCNDNAIARDAVHDKINQVIHFLSEQYIRIMNDISSKMGKYIDVLLARLKFMESSGSTDMRDLVESFLIQAVSNIQADKSWIEQNLNLFNLYRCMQVDPRGLKKIKKRRERVIDSVEEIEEISAEEEAASLMEIRKRIDNPYSADKMAMILNRMTEDGRSVSLKDMPSGTNGDFLRAMAASCYADATGYSIEDYGGYVESGDYMLANILIKRRTDEDDHRGN